VRNPSAAQGQFGNLIFGWRRDRRRSAFLAALIALLLAVRSSDAFFNRFLAREVRSGIYDSAAEEKPWLKVIWANAKGATAHTSAEGGPQGARSPRFPLLNGKPCFSSLGLSLCDSSRSFT